MHNIRMCKYVSSERILVAGIIDDSADEVVCLFVKMPNGTEILLRQVDAGYPAHAMIYKVGERSLGVISRLLHGNAEEPNQEDLTTALEGFAASYLSNK